MFHARDINDCALRCTYQMMRTRLDVPNCLLCLRLHQHQPTPQNPINRINVLQCMNILQNGGN